MRAFDAVYVAALGAALAEAGVELFISRRNERRLRREGFREVAPWVFRAMVPVYLTAFVAGPLERFGNPARTEPWPLLLGLVAALAAAKALKAWVIVTLRGAWTKKVFVRQGMPIRTDGPFAWMRHPNYLAMVLEIGALGFMGATPVAGTAVGVAFGVLLLLRISTEEQGLAAVAPYREIMGLRPSRGS